MVRKIDEMKKMKEKLMVFLHDDMCSYYTIQFRTIHLIFEIIYKLQINYQIVSGMTKALLHRDFRVFST